MRPHFKALHARRNRPGDQFPDQSKVVVGIFVSSAICYKKSNHHVIILGEWESLELGVFSPNQLCRFSS